MAAKNNNGSLDVNEEAVDVVEKEIAKGEQDDLLDHPKPKKEKIRKLRAKTAASRITKHGVPRSIVELELRNERIDVLARPTKQRALITLRERGLTLPPTFVDNLIRIIEAESCLTPEEAAQVRREKRERTKVKARLPRVKKWMREISKDMEDATMDRDAAMCQYLMAKHFVRSILEYQCCTSRKDTREIADVIARRLMSYEAYADARNDDRAAQQLRLLADVVACWIAEILAEVASIRKHTLEEYCRKRKMKMEVDDDNGVNNEAQDWKQIELKGKERRERKKNEFETEGEISTAEKERRSENEQRERENVESEALTGKEEGVRQQIDEEVKKDDEGQAKGNIEKVKEEIKEEEAKDEKEE